MTSPRSTGSPAKWGDIGRVLSMLPAIRQRTLWWLGAASVLNAICEAAAIALVVPILQLMLGKGGDDSKLDIALRLLPLPDGNDRLVALCFLVAALLVVSNILSAMVVAATARFSWDSWREFVSRVFAFYLMQPYEFYLQRNSSQLLKMTTQDTLTVTNRVLLPLLQIVSRGTIIVMVSVTLIFLFPGAALVLIGMLLLAYSVVYLVVRPVIRSLARRLWRTRTTVSRTVNEAYQGIRELRVFGREAVYLHALNRLTDTLPKLEQRHALVRSAPRYLLQGGLTVLSLVIIGMAVRFGYPIAELGTAVGVCALAGLRLLPLFTTAYGQFVELRFGLGELETLLDDLDAASHASAAVRLHEDEAPSPVIASLSLEKVYYRYPGTDTDVLRDVSLQISRGEVIGLIGASGSGKSTLIDVLLGLVPPTNGQILCNGEVLNTNALRTLRRGVGYVSQHTFLIDDTVAANIALGVNPDAIDQTALEKSARAAAIDSAIAQMPQGYAQPLGERGVRLSGGQRQRIAIARALYHQPTLLIFDEATSALDVETERAVLTALTCQSDRTVLLATHRLDTLSICDRIYEVRDGRVSQVSLDSIIQKNRSLDG